MSDDDDQRSRELPRRDFPILEHDDASEAMIEPRRLIAPIDIPAHAVACFFQDVLSRLVAEAGARVAHHLRSELGMHPIYELEVGGRRLAVFHPGIGAPFAAAFLEEMIALGCSRFIACGGAGALDRALAVGHVLVPTAAVRDEGTSYHYLPPAREVAAAAEAVAAIEATLDAHDIPYRLTTTWTTDAIYRETPARVRRRREEGCLTVEMEAAAFFAVARFRGVPCGQILYSGDLLDGAAWDGREWQSRADLRQRLFWLAAEACLRL